MQRGLMQPSRRPFTPHLTLAKVPPASPRLRQAQGEREVAVWWGRGAGDLVGVDCAWRPTPTSLMLLPSPEVQEKIGRLRIPTTEIIKSVHHSMQPSETSPPRHTLPTWVQHMALFCCPNYNSVPCVDGSQGATTPLCLSSAWMEHEKRIIWAFHRSSVTHSDVTSVSINLKPPQHACRPITHTEDGYGLRSVFLCS